MKPAHILAIDDERVVCDGCRLVLTERGHRVESRLAGRAGLDAMRGNGFEVVLLDMKLPDINGMEVLRTIRQEHPGVRVVVMTGYASVQDAIEALKLGAFDYLQKPFSDDELVSAVEKAVKGKRLADENLALRNQIFQKFEFTSIVGEDPGMEEVFHKIRKVSPTDSTVLLVGESGTGKELFARAIHGNSRRSGRQLVAVDCSTFSPSLLESELFGHVKGAFTGAVGNKAGIFEVANEGTLFLDEVSNLSLEVQGKLLRVMETREYKPVGAEAQKKTDVRVIAATNQSLEAFVEKGRFRQDLYYRLNVLPIFIPPLRERKTDISRLAYHFLRIFCRESGKRIQGFSDEALDILIGHAWPGNVRQLRNVVERLVIMAERTVLDHNDLMSNMRMDGRFRDCIIPETIGQLKAFKRDVLQQTYQRVEKAFIEKALEASQGNITRAAEKVGMQRSNFSALIKKHKLSASG